MLCNRKCFAEKALTISIGLTLLFIWGNSVLDSEMSAGVSNGLLDYIRPLLDLLGLQCASDIWLRKLAHFCEFALLGAEFSALSFLKYKRRFWDYSLCALYCLAAAAADETIQYFSGRYPHILDVLLDFSGGLFGIVLMLIVLSAVIGYKGKTI